jgi:hypothetical protein
MYVNFPYQVDSNDHASPCSVAERVAAARELTPSLYKQMSGVREQAFKVRGDGTVYREAQGDVTVTPELIRTMFG